MDTSILRSARIARRLTVQTIAALTKLSPRAITAIEAGRFGDLPPGVYARAYVRMYANAVGIGDSSLIRPIIDAIPMVDVDLGAIAKCRETAGDRRSRTRSAAMVDTAIVALLSACGVLLCVVLTGATAWDLASVAVAFLTLAVPTLILYLGLLGATGVGTAGACLLRVDLLPGLNGPLDGTLLVRRTFQYFCREAIALLVGRTRLTASPSVTPSAPTENVW